MNTIFDTESYWIERGRHYIHETRLQEDFSIHQVEYVADVVTHLKPQSILELGCGYGRITREIAKKLPETSILAIDLSEDQLLQARQYCMHSNVTFRQQNIKYGSIQGSFDLILAIEVFLHLPTDIITNVCFWLSQHTKALLHDFDREHPILPLSPHVWAHDYPSIYAGLGLRYAVLESGPYSLMLVTC